MSRRILLPILIVIIGVLGATALVKLRPQPSRVTPPDLVPLVSVQEVSTTAHDFTVLAQGTVRARTESKLVAEVAGRVLKVDDDFNEGGFFEVGQVLLELDDRDHRAAVAAAEAEVATARLGVAREEEEASVARGEWDRFEREGEPSGLVLREPQLAQARALLASAEARLERARRDLDRTRIRAPFTGRVRTKLADIGDYVAPGTPTAAIYAVDFAEVHLPLPDEELAFLDLPSASGGADEPVIRGPAVTLTGDFAGQEHEWFGYVHRTGGEIDPRTRMFTVVVRVADPYGSGASPDGTPLRVGLFVTAHIEGRGVQDVVVIPRSAMIGADQVAVVDADNRIRLRDVMVLRSSQRGVVIGSGLQAGERVATSRLEFVVDGMQVRTSSAGVSQ